MTTFKDLSLSKPIQQAIDALGFDTPTEIQQKAISALLVDQRVDLLGQAQTGTGKTFAFGIPLLHKIDTNSNQVQALIVAPTRELVVQIRDSLRQLTKFMPHVSIEAIYGGASMPEQIRALKRGVHIVVGTPGRLNDHLNRKTLSFKSLQTLVLDEADTMLDMGFRDEVDEILNQTPEDRQIWLFSATIKSGVSDLMKSHMKNPVSILVNRKDSAPSNTKQYFSIVSRQNRLDSLCRFIDSAQDMYGFIFCQTKMLTAEVTENLIKRGYEVNALHGDMSQAQRNNVIKKFKKKEFSILVATDVAARGIDVSEATHVFNFSLPDDQESYVHRIGRTGRAGKDGIAITFISQSEQRRLRSIGQKFKFDILPLEIPKAETIALAQQEKALEYLKVGIQTNNSQNKLVQALHAKIAPFSKEELVNAISHALYEKFLKHIVPTRDIETPSFDGAYQGGGDEGDSELCEFFMSIGEDDGINKNDIVEHLTSTNMIKRDDVKKIKILRKHTFAVVPTQLAQDAMQSLFGKTIQGKRVRIDITNETPNLHRGGGDRGERSEGSRRQGGGSHRRDNAQGSSGRRRSFGTRYSN